MSNVMSLCLRLPIFFFLTFSIVAKTQFLEVSDNHKFLQQGDGTPFFYLGDTAWELFHRLSLEDAEKYLKNRAAKGFTVIQAVVLAQLGGVTEPNANGDLPLVNADPTRPVEAYFKHVDDIVETAESLGLTIGMLPTWGHFWSTTHGDQKIFNTVNAYEFGKFMGERYRDHFIIWILGGDENVNNDEERKIVEAMARGIQEGDGQNLMTFHPRGPGRSSDYFHDADWLDFNMYQSSHAGHGHDNGLYAEHDIKLLPRKPTLDGEPRYELIPVGFYFNGPNKWDLFGDYDTRQAAYWSLLAGACGHTYGHNSIWQMYSKSHDPVIGVQVPWFEAIDHPGSFQMGYLKSLFESRPFYQLNPAQSLILGGPDFGGGKIRGAIAEDQSFAIIYSPQGEQFIVDQHQIKAKKIKAIWFDPRYGLSHPFHTGVTRAIQTYTPPTQGDGQDWILILEDANKNYPLPGH